MQHASTSAPVIPAKAGTQGFLCSRAGCAHAGNEMNAATKKAWIPAFAGTSGCGGLA